jgi:two-component system, NarL family, sensor kinase
MPSNVDGSDGTPLPTAGPGARWRAGPRWRRRVAIALAAVAALPALAFVAHQSSTASDGAHLRPGTDAVTSAGVVVVPLRSDAAGLRDGDVVVAVGGVGIDDVAGRLVAGSASAAVPDARLAGLRDGWRPGAVVAYTVLRDGVPVRVDVALGAHPLLRAVARTWGTVLFALVNLLVVGLVFARRPDLPATQVLFAAAGALVGATTWSLGLRVADLVTGVGFWLYQLTTVGAFGAYWIGVFHFAALFPRPLPMVRRRAFAVVAYGGSFAALVGYIALLWVRTPEPLERIAGIAPFTGAHAAFFLALALVAVVVQFRRAPVGEARAQIRWVVLAAVVAGVGGLSLYLVPPLLGASAVSPNVIGLLASAFPVGVALAVFHHRLFDIDALLNRALVYAALTAVIGTAYVLVVTVLGGMFQSRGGLGPGLVASGVVAVLVLPLRARLQRGVDRVMYGDRADPAAVLGRLGARLEQTLAPDAVLPTLAQTVAEALRLPYVAIELVGGERGGARVAYGRAGGAAERFPLAYRGEVLGFLVVASRGPEEAFTEAERVLLASIARQAGIAAHAARSTDDLRRSRERLVSAREEERRRLRRELHDGVGPALASLALKLDAATNVLDRDREAARALLVQLRHQVDGAIGDLRGVVHALRPPALDDLGLVGALREVARSSARASLEVEFDAPEAFPHVPAAVEVAAYRIVQEALANVVRHAGARRARVALSVGEDLTVAVEDDGVGRSRAAAPGPARGVGVPSMRERAMELGGTFAIGPRAGGGTRVEARLPLGHREAATVRGEERGSRGAPEVS